MSETGEHVPPAIDDEGYHEDCPYRGFVVDGTEGKVWVCNKCGRGGLVQPGVRFKNYPAWVERVARATHALGDHLHDWGQTGRGTRDEYRKAVMDAYWGLSEAAQFGRSGGSHE